MNLETQQTVKFRIKRQAGPDQTPHWEDFEVPWKASLNVITLLMMQHESPKTIDGQQSTPASYDANCLEEVCGSCSMIINGKVRQACTALVDQLEQPITLEPMSKFPLVRDLQVDRKRMFESLKWIKAWMPVDTYAAMGAGPRISPTAQEEAYNYSRCMTCGCCLESCPQWSSDEGFIGPQAIAQAMLFNLHPTGKSLSSERVNALIDNGLNVCGNAQNCAAVCPKEVNLLQAISQANWGATKEMAKSILGNVSRND